jgi:hypothetical protein
LVPVVASTTCLSKIYALICIIGMGLRKIVEETSVVCVALSLGLVTDLMMHKAFYFSDGQTMVATGELAHVSLSSILLAAPCHLIWRLWSVCLL